MAEGTRQQPWVEKYRPKTIDEIAHQEEVVATLRSSLETANLPHLLFYGPPGTGKTSTILAVAKQLFGPELYSNRVKELNASDERGIDVVRTKIKNFASLAVAEKRDADYPYPCPPYKIVILDEADSMTMDAQSALRRTMEVHTKVTRFCIICNYVSRIIEPLTSRCAKFRFKPLSEDAMMNRLQFVCTQEGLNLPQDLLRQVIDVSGGDMRKAITTLQNGCTLYGTDLSRQRVLDIAGVVPPERIAELLDVCRSKGFDKVKATVQSLILDGYGGSQLVSQISDYVISAADITNIQRSRIAVTLADVDRNLVERADEELQVLHLSSRMSTILSS